MIGVNNPNLQVLIRKKNMHIYSHLEPQLSSCDKSPGLGIMVLNKLHITWRGI